MAIDDCNNLIKSDKYNTGGYYLRGCGYEKLNNINQAI